MLRQIFNVLGDISHKYQQKAQLSLG